MSPSIFEFISLSFVVIFVGVVIFLIIVIIIVLKLLRMNVNEDNSKKIDIGKDIVEPTVHLIELSKKGDKKENNARVNAQFCTFCGENVSEGLKHCPFCGAETK
jgi:5-bromo-4-chloroindolyl phosphate hydrolysis protein